MQQLPLLLLLLLSLLLFSACQLSTAAAAAAAAGGRSQNSNEDEGANLVNFNGFRLYRLIPTTQDAVNSLNFLHERFPAEPDPQSGLIFLKQPSRPMVPVDIIVSPLMTDEPFWQDLIKRNDVVVNLLRSDYGRLIKESTAQNQNGSRRGRRSTSTFDNLTLQHQQFRRYSELLEAIEKLVAKCNSQQPDVCSFTDIGVTENERKLRVLKIRKPQAGKQKRKIWIDGGIHAREWISPASVLFIADTLISLGLGSDGGSEEMKKLIDNFDFYLLVLYNPDGYEYSHMHNRLWRKNRQNVAGPLEYRLCRGIDLNRNYGFHWGGSGSSDDICADNYRGSAPFSAKETAAVSKYLREENGDKKFLLFLSYHSYGQYLLMPFGYKKTKYPMEPFHKRIRCVAFRTSHEMFAKNYRLYVYGTSADVLYEASGGSDDWAHGDLKIPYSLTIELPDDGAYGFLLPPAYILSVGNEAMVGMVAMLRTIDGLEKNEEYYNNNCRETKDNNT